MSTINQDSEGKVQVFIFHCHLQFSHHCTIFCALSIYHSFSPPSFLAKWPKHNHNSTPYLNWDPSGNPRPQSQHTGVQISQNLSYRMPIHCSPLQHTKIQQSCNPLSRQRRNQHSSILGRMGEGGPRTQRSHSNLPSLEIFVLPRFRFAELCLVVVST
jgi:hypothetical protein